MTTQVSGSLSRRPVHFHLDLFTSPSNGRSTRLSSCSHHSKEGFVSSVFREITRILKPQMGCKDKRTESQGVKEKSLRSTGSNLIPQWTLKSVKNRSLCLYCSPVTLEKET